MDNFDDILGEDKEDEAIESAGKKWARKVIEEYEKIKKADEEYRRRKKGE